METVRNPGLINVLIPLFIIVFIIAVSVVLLYQHFQKNLFIQKLAQETLKSNHQAELLRANIQAQEDERKRIAQDIHDELGAVLSIMRMNMMMLEQQNADISPGLLTGMQNVRSLAESALTNMRSISHRLMPPQLETFGLIKTLESVIMQLNKSGSLRVTLSAATEPGHMSLSVSLGLYRIIMELLNNTIKHSGATEATIDINERDGTIQCRYTDNGKGLTDDVMGHGMGYKSIWSRISALDGTLEIEKAGVGFCAVMLVPLR